MFSISNVNWHTRFPEEMRCLNNWNSIQFVSVKVSDKRAPFHGTRVPESALGEIEAALKLSKCNLSLVPEVLPSCLRSTSKQGVSSTMHKCSFESGISAQGIKQFLWWRFESRNLTTKLKQHCNICVDTSGICTICWKLPNSRKKCFSNYDESKLFMLGGA